MTLTGTWSYPTAIRFGAGRIEELPAACAEAGIERPLFVTDRGLAALPVTGGRWTSSRQAASAAPASPRSTRTRRSGTWMPASRPFAQMTMTASSPSAAGLRSISAR